MKSLQRGDVRAELVGIVSQSVPVRAESGEIIRSHQREMLLAQSTGFGG
jgi:hypothetical protein